MKRVSARESQPGKMMRIAERKGRLNETNWSGGWYIDSPINLEVSRPFDWPAT